MHRPLDLSATWVMEKPLEEQGNTIQPTQRTGARVFRQRNSTRPIMAVRCRIATEGLSDPGWTAWMPKARARLSAS